MAVNPLVKALQLPEGSTVRKVKGVLKVVPARKTVIAKKEETMEDMIVAKVVTDFHRATAFAKRRKGEFDPATKTWKIPANMLDPWKEKDGSYDLSGYGMKTVTEDEIREDMQKQADLEKEEDFLYGTEKQVKWASDIRQKMLLEVPEFMRELESKYDKMSDQDKERQKSDFENAKRWFEEGMLFLQSQKQAKWWIENRSSGSSWIRHFVKEKLKNER